MSENNNNDNIKKYCSICHRSEDEAGKMLKLPGGTYACVDCLQKMLDSFGNPNMGGLNFPSFPGMSFDGLFPGTMGNSGEPIETTAVTEVMEEKGEDKAEPLPPITPDEGKPENPEKKNNPPKKWLILGL